MAVPRALPGFLRSSTFRLSVFYVALFFLSVGALLAFIYVQAIATIDTQTEQATKADAAALVQEYTAQGIAGLIDAVEDRIAPDRAGDGLYLLEDDEGAPLAANVQTWPTAEPNPGGWVSFNVDREDGPHQARGLTYALKDGSKLLVARDLHARLDFQELMVDALYYALALTVVLGVGGGLLISRRMLNRLDAINRAAERIRTGDLSHRIGTTGSHDEFDRLSETLNAMLEEIHRLMNGMRTVTDNIAHDLRSPLTRMKGRLEMLLREPADTDAQRVAIERTIADADQLLTTFTALLSIADAQSGSARATMAPLDLDELAGDIVDLYEPAAEERGIAIGHEEGQGSVMGSRQLLFQALVNLVDNAIKNTPAGGTIQVAVRRQAGAVHFVVADSGPGIPETERDRVLEPFVRLDSSRSTPGSGLGLALVAAIARLHGARIELGDNAPGLVVSLIFPVVA
ncbi:MAG TPA: HAMP domain-containing sensor histidine kinase [Alphaproteobacteria bacterium]|nr:HAMP domain-containing sensor histidine kinase [Alphaproteobacteria bacterium]